MSFGPDAVYGDHVGLHRLYAGNLSLKESRKKHHEPPPEEEASTSLAAGMEFEPVEWVQGLENPTEAGHNILRWLVKAGYSDDEIAKVMGGNVLRVLGQVWG